MAIESYAQQGEDMVLWPVLEHLPYGRYVDVGANDPIVDSISYSFYQRGWSGIPVEPVAEFADKHSELRPNDKFYQCSIAAEERTETLYVAPGTGLSTLRPEYAQERSVPVQVAGRRLDSLFCETGWQRGHTICFMVVDVEGSERAVFESFDLAAWSPWYLCVEAVAPNRHDVPTYGEWEDIVLGAGYRFDRFDGVNRFYSAPGHPRLTPT